MAGPGRGGFSDRSVLTIENQFRRFTDLPLVAIRIYRKRGRTKKELNGKQCGGNEFISDFIKKTTGVERTRKQVSSHLQVLKEFLKDNKCCGSDSPKIRGKMLISRSQG